MQASFRKLNVLAVMIIALFASAVRAADLAQAPSPQEQTRAAFLKLIDRPKVPLTPEVKQESTDNGIVHFHFTYATQPEQRVPGILLMREAFTKDGKRHPVVIVLHGTGGRKESELNLLTKFADRDFIAVAIDGRYHGERGKLADYNAAIARAFAQGGEHPFYYDTVWDVMRLIDYLQTRGDVDPDRIGLMGFSKGGIETWLTAAADTRVACAVPCIGVQCFNWALENDAWHARVGTVQAGFSAAARSAGVEHPDADFCRKFYDRVVPGIYSTFDGPEMLPLISPRPLMTINGENDDKTPLPGLKLCTDAAHIAYQRDDAERKFLAIVEPKTGHAVNKETLNAAVDWFSRWIGNEAKVR